MNFAKVAVGLLTAAVAIGSMVLGVIRYVEGPSNGNTTVIPQPVYQHPTYGCAQPVYSSNGGNPMPMNNVGMFNQQPVYQQPVYQQPVYQQSVYQQPPAYQYTQQPVYSYNYCNYIDPWPSCMEVLGIDPRVYPQPTSIQMNNYNNGYPYYDQQSQNYDSRRYSGYGGTQQNQNNSMYQQQSSLPNDQASFDAYWDAIYKKTNDDYMQYISNMQYYQNNGYNNYGYPYAYDNYNYNYNYNTTGEIWAPYNNGQPYNQSFYNNGISSDIPGVRCENVYEYNVLGPNMVDTGNISRYTGSRDFDKLFEGQGVL